MVESSTAEPQDIEPDLIREFAGRIDAEVIWTRGSEAALAQCLKHHEIDLAAPGWPCRTHGVSRYRLVPKTLLKGPLPRHQGRIRPNPHFDVGRRSEL